MGPDQVFHTEVHIPAEAPVAEFAPAEPDGGQTLNGAGEKPEQEECADMLVEEVGGTGAGEPDRRDDHQHQRHQVEAVKQTQQAQGSCLEVEQDHAAVNGRHKFQIFRYAEPGPDPG